jgi:hypothetical protein
VPRTAVLACLAFVVALSPPPAEGGSISVEGQFVSTAPTGTPPLAVDSTTMVTNLNAHYLNGLPASAFSSALGNVVRVGMSGGEFTSIQAALDSITDAGVDNFYVVLVGPGLYQESITLKNFVSVVGHGRLETRIEVESTGSVTAVHGAPLGFLRDLWIVARSTGGGTATAIDGPFYLAERVVAYAVAAPGGQATGLRLTGSVDVDLIDSELWALDGDVNTGLFMETPASVGMKGGVIRGQSLSPGATNYGVRRSFVSGSGSLDLEGVGVYGNAGSIGYGIRSEKGSMVLRRCTVFASGSNQAVGVYNGENTTYSVLDSNITAYDAPHPMRIGFQQAAGTVLIHRSSLTGSPAIDVASGAQARIAYSQIFQFLNGAGTYSCIGNYGNAMSPVACP